MRNRLTLGIGAALLLALGGCGEKKAGGGGVTVSTEDVDAALERLTAEQNARSQITMVDAATGDARAMPAERHGPTAYDLRGTENESESKPEESKEKPDIPLVLAPAPPPDETFPSVAE
jgi:hypothetical protein